MSFNSSSASPISVRLSDVENGAALTIGSAMLQLAHPEAIELTDELSRALARKPLPAIPSHAQESRRSAHRRVPLEAGSEPYRLCLAIA
jgi:hypothetical protein